MSTNVLITHAYILLFPHTIHYLHTTSRSRGLICYGVISFISEYELFVLILVNQP